MTSMEDLEMVVSDTATDDKRPPVTTKVIGNEHESVVQVETQKSDPTPMSVNGASDGHCYSRLAALVAQEWGTEM